MIDLKDIHHDYGQGAALQLAAFSLMQGEQALVIGPSGSGKTTLLHLLAGLLHPQRGEVTVAGVALSGLSPAALDHFRGRHIGFVPQRLHLIGALSALENLLLAQYLAGKKQNPPQALALLESLGLTPKANAKPHRLSQGQAQRLAIARALINQPGVLLADEPTANLDDQNAQTVCDLLQTQARAFGATLLIATHDRRLKERFAHQLALEAAP